MRPKVNGEILVATRWEEKAEPYLAALAAVGVPAERLRVVIPSPAANAEARGLAAAAAGLVLCGGVDVEPWRYGEEPLPSARVESYPERDELEWALLDGARDGAVPVWGVCRGIQVLNVYLGGSLWQDLASQRGGEVPHTIDEPKDALAHMVTVVESTAPLGDVLARETAYVNSRHHQAIKRLAPGFVAVAESPDGVVEAAVLAPGGAANGWWVRGVQWHPENLVAMAQQRALWEAFARAAGVV